MLTTLLIWLYTGCLAFIYGFLLIQVLVQVFRDRSGEIPYPPITILLGLVLITILTGYLSLAIKIGVLAHVLFLCGAVLIVVFMLQTFTSFIKGSWASLQQVHPLAWIVFILMVLFALLKTPSEPANYDTGLYHAQAIRWIEEYPVIPGLGNLFRNLAYNSVWFLTSAFSSFSFLGGQSFHVMAGFLFLIFSLFGSIKLSGLLRGSVSLCGLCVVGGLFLARWLFGLEISSPGTDLPAALICWFIFTIALESLEDRSFKNLNWRSGSVLILSVFAITLKLNLLPVLIIPAALLIVARKQIRMRLFVYVGLLSLAIGFPWVARSVIQSGYLVYPVYQINIFDPDWKIPAKYVQEDVEWIYSWPRMPRVDKDIVLQMSYQEWVPPWYQAQTRNDHYLLYGLAAGSILLGVVILFQSLRKKISWENIRWYVPLYLTGLVGIVYWFLQAPVFRYGYAFIGITICLLFAPLGAWLLRSHRIIRLTGTAGILLFLMAYYGQGLYKMRSPEYLKEVALLPKDYPIVDVRQERLGNFEVFMPIELDQCWYTPLPCTPLHNPEVNLRRLQFGDGFFNKH